MRLRCRANGIYGPGAAHGIVRRIIFRVLPHQWPSETGLGQPGQSCKQRQQQSGCKGQHHNHRADGERPRVPDWTGRGGGGGGRRGLGRARSRRRRRRRRRAPGTRWKWRRHGWIRWKGRRAWHRWIRRWTWGRHRRWRCIRRLDKSHLTLRQPPIRR